jgi:hypothetical protein
MTRRHPSTFAEFVAARSASLHRTAFLMVDDVRSQVSGGLRVED